MARSTIVVWVAVALALIVVLVVYLNRPVRRVSLVSLPKGTKFPACLFDLDPNLHTCDEILTAFATPPVD